MEIQQSFCTFCIDNLLFGIEVLRIQEVIRAQKMTRVPRSNPVVRGLMNLRGQIVTALDLRLRLGLPERREDKPLMNVVIRAADGPVSLLVDDIGDVLEVDSRKFESAPETLQGPMRALIRGVYKLEGQLLLALNVEPLLKLSI